jgi:CheY-like chemotaxis protein/two-component sensor histidine kinase
MEDQVQEPDCLPSDHEARRPKKLNDLHTTFMQNVSHEFRTPLSVIQGYAELLHAGDLGMLEPEQEEAMYIIVNRVNELRTLVERMSTLMAIDANMGVTAPLDLGKLVTHVVAAHQPAAVSSDLELTFELEPDLPWVEGDMYHFQQAIECLVDNAIKFTPEGGTIRTRAYSEDDLVILTVEDTGIGIEKKEFNQIFDRFYQVDGSSTRRYGGVGLGLSVAKAVVEKYCGQIQIESRVGEGSRFVIRLPALPPHARTTESMESSTMLQRILIVDDEENVVLTLKDGLEKLPNCEILTAMSGEEALQLFDEEPFDLLITDYRMLDIDGMTLAAHIRSTYPQTSIVMVTAYGNETLRQQAAEASISRVLEKPIALAEIRSVAMRELGKEDEAA